MREESKKEKKSTLYIHLSRPLVISWHAYDMLIGERQAHDMYVLLFRVGSGDGNSRT
jgi:hypothetical protein